MHISIYTIKNLFHARRLVRPGGRYRRMSILSYARVCIYIRAVSATLRLENGSICKSYHGCYCMFFYGKLTFSTQTQAQLWMGENGKPACNSYCRYFVIVSSIIHTLDHPEKKKSPNNLTHFGAWRVERITPSNLTHFGQCRVEKYHLAILHALDHTE